MANKPVSGALGYDSAADRPTAQLVSGVKKLLTEDDATGGSITSITSSGGTVTITNPSGPVVNLEVPAGDITAVTAGTGLTGGGTSGAVALAADFGTGAGKVMQGNQTAGGDASGTLDALVVTQARGLRETAGPTTLTMGAVADLAFLKRSGSTIVGVLDSSQSELHCPPATADSRDDEFNSVTLPAGYGMYDIASGLALTAPSKTALLFTVPGAGLSRYQAHTDRRPSWLHVQVAQEMLLLKAFTFGTNDFTWTRLLTQQDTTSSGSTIELLLTIAAATGGHPDPANRIYLGNTISNGISAFTFARRVIAGVTTNIPAAEAPTLVNESRGGGHGYDYFGIDKVGTKYRFYASARGYRRWWSDANAITFTPAYIGWSMKPGTVDSTIFGIDFLRFNTGGFLASPL